MCQSEDDSIAHTPTRTHHNSNFISKVCPEEDAALLVAPDTVLGIPFDYYYSAQGKREREREWERNSESHAKKYPGRKFRVFFSISWGTGARKKVACA